MPGAIVTVGATNESERRADYAQWGSNYGEPVGIYAPGNSILSAMPGGNYGWMSGTSMASPMVAGAFANCLLERRRDGPSGESQRERNRHCLREILECQPDYKVDEPNSSTAQPLMRLYKHPQGCPHCNAGGDGPGESEEPDKPDEEDPVVNECVLKVDDGGRTGDGMPLMVTRLCVLSDLIKGEEYQVTVARADGYIPSIFDPEGNSLDRWNDDCRNQDIPTPEAVLREMCDRDCAEDNGTTGPGACTPFQSGVGEARLRFVAKASGDHKLNFSIHSGRGEYHVELQSVLPREPEPEEPPVPEDPEPEDPVSEEPVPEEPESEEPVPEEPEDDTPFPDEPGHEDPHHPDDSVCRMFRHRNVNKLKHACEKKMWGEWRGDLLDSAGNPLCQDNEGRNFHLCCRFACKNLPRGDKCRLHRDICEWVIERDANGRAVNRYCQNRDPAADPDANFPYKIVDV